MFYVAPYIDQVMGSLDLVRILWLLGVGTERVKSL